MLKIDLSVQTAGHPLTVAYLAAENGSEPFSQKSDPRTELASLGSIRQLPMTAPLKRRNSSQASHKSPRGP